MSKQTEPKFVELYFSVDIEAVGPIPGQYSMSALGASLAGGRTEDGKIVRFDHTQSENVFYRELKPLNENYVTDAIMVGGLRGFDADLPDPDGSRRFAWLQEHGTNPRAAMVDFGVWVAEMRLLYGGRAVFMAYPASFDWTFVYWYFIAHNLPSPFGFSNVIDLKTYYSAWKDTPLTRSTKRFMDRHIFSKLPHTHFADDDAIEQGIMGMNMLSMRQS